MVRRGDATILAPEFMTRLVVEALFIKARVPEPENSRFMNGEDVAMTLFCCVEVEVKVVVAVLVCEKIEVEDANQLPAREKELAPMVRIEVVAVPS